MRETDRGNMGALEGPSRAGRRSGHSFGIGWFLALLLAAGLWAPSALGQMQGGDDIDRQYLIKAAFLYNFGRYVQWPPGVLRPDSHFVIGILGQDPFGTAIDQIGATKTVESRPIAIRRFSAMADYRPCQILFVAAGVSPAEQAAAIRQTLAEPVLLVGDDAEFAQQGGVIGFFVQDNRIHFEINPEAAKRRQLQISSKLLNLGRLVQK